VVGLPAFDRWVLAGAFPLPPAPPFGGGRKQMFPSNERDRSGFPPPLSHMTFFDVPIVFL